ncbi:VOC family protein [Couchioplanes azureus]|uniref:VOC family protein n=1 Tax=Couchioplanes caeruleus TaxID=56438 RepID=UPI0016701496|nr:VOC family protein [Couchioplanes caeruleus]
MAYDFQVTVDSTDPHTQAEWWAETLGWQVEPQDEDFIRDMVAKGFATEDETLVFRGRLVWKTGAAIVHPEKLPSGKPRRMLFNHVPEPKIVKDRIHVDVWVGDEHRERVRDELVARGATFVQDGRQGPFTWCVMRDPEGNEFCIS